MIIVFVKIIISNNISMIMITSKCFILLLLPPPVSCVWIDHSYQSVTRPFIFLVVIRCHDLAMMMIMMKIGKVCNNDPVSHIIRAQNQCLGHQGLLVSRASILPRLAAQHTQRDSSISHVTLSPCHHHIPIQPPFHSSSSHFVHPHCGFWDPS